MSTLTQDPMTGMWSSNTSPTGTGRSMTELNGGIAPVNGTSGGAPDPYTEFNRQLATILTQIQTASSAGAANLGRSKDALQTEAVGAAGAYDPTATPGVNLQNQTGTLGAFAPAIADVNTQLENANTSVSNLGTEISGLETAYKPTPLAPGDSTITPGGTTVHQGHSYTPTVNPQTGLVDGFDQNTGTWASDDGGGGGASQPSGGGSSSIESIFGKSNPIGAYATDPNYVKEISGLYSTVSSLGVAQSPEALQQYIKNNASSSPVTGQMILNAATTYGIDPAMLTTILLHESDFGTAGVAVKTMNPGNIGNTGTSTQAYNSWQQGVNAAAKNIAARVAAAGKAAATAQTPGATATSKVGGSFSPVAAQRVAQLPAAMQSYVDAGPIGVAYVNDDRVPSQLKQSVQTMAAHAGIPYIQAGDVSAIKSIETVLSNLDSMQQLANKTLNSGVVGHAIDATIGRGAEWAQTEWGQNLGLFDNYRDTAIKAVQALAGGAGSGLRINMGEIAANTQNLPQSSDSLENASKQITQLKQLIYTQLATTFPYAPIKVMNPSGATGSIPVSQLGDAIKAGYKVI